jgi:hypothetical protein
LDNPLFQPLVPPGDGGRSGFFILVVPITKVIAREPSQSLDGIEPHGWIIVIQVGDHLRNVLLIPVPNIRLYGRNRNRRIGIFDRSRPFGFGAPHGKRTEYTRSLCGKAKSS